MKNWQILLVFIFCSAIAILVINVINIKAKEVTPVETITIGGKALTLEEYTTEKTRLKEKYVEMKDGKVTFEVEPENNEWQAYADILSKEITKKRIDIKGDLLNSFNNNL